MIYDDITYVPDSTAEGKSQKQNARNKHPLFLPQLPKQAQLAKREASKHSLAIPTSSTFGLKMAFFDNKCYFQPQY